MSFSDFGNQVQKGWDKTRGYKTVSGGALLLLYKLIGLLFPDIKDENWMPFIREVIDFIIYTGIVDKLWHNRDILIDFMVSLYEKTFKKKKDE